MGHSSLQQYLLLFVLLWAHQSVMGQDPPSTYILDGSAILDCRGFFTDSGGPNGSYGTNENLSTVICPAAGGGNTHIRLNFSSLDIGPDDELRIFDGATNAGPPFDIAALSAGGAFAVQATASNPTGCLTVEFVSGNQNGRNEGWSAAIECTIGCQTVEAQLVMTDPSIIPVDTGYIDICPGDRVFFEAMGLYPQNGIAYAQSDNTSTFEWDFGDGNTAVGPQVTNVFDESGGYTVQLTITDAEGCRNVNFISQRVRVATVPTFLLEGELRSSLCSGDSLSISSAVNTSSDTTNLSAMPNMGSFRQRGVRSDTLLLPDGDGDSYTSSIFFNQFSPGAVLTDADDICGISLLLEHSYAGDLDISISCPNGNTVALVNQTGGSTNYGLPFSDGSVDSGDRSNDFTRGIPFEYTFVNSGSQYGPLSTAPRGDTTYTTVPSEVDGRTFRYSDTYFYPGTYEPVDPFTILEGCPLNGEWTITVTDNIRLDNGWLFEWSICFADELYPELETFTPELVNFGWRDNPTMIQNEPRGIVASPINAGAAAYTFFVEDNFGCTFDTTLNFEILPPTHPNCYTCEMDIMAQADTVICGDETVALNLSPTAELEQCITFDAFPGLAYDQASSTAGNTWRFPINVNSIQPLRLTNPLEQICSVCIDIATDFTGDLRIELESPQGDRLLLAAANGGTGGYRNTCFSPQALQDINSGNGTYSGEFQPEDDWFRLIGGDINGTWTLIVTDLFVGPNDSGEILQWSLSLNNTNTYSYTWTPSAGLNGCTDCATPVADPEVTTTYAVAIEDAFGCTLADTIVVGVIADLPPPNVSCLEDGPNITFSWDPLPGITAYEYRLTLNGNTEDWLGPISALSYTEGGLVLGDEIRLEVRPFFAATNPNCPPAVGSSDCVSTYCGLEATVGEIRAVSCFGAQDGTLEVNIIAGVPGFSVQIDNTGPFLADTLISGLAAGPHLVTVRDGLGCEQSLPFEVPTPDSLFVTIEQEDISCFGANESSARAIAGGGVGTTYTYQWDDPQQQRSITATGLAPGPINLVVQDSSGCTASASAIIRQYDEITLTLDSEPPSCADFADGTIRIRTIMGSQSNNPADYTFSWSTGDSGVAISGLAGDQSYSVTATDSQGCTQTATVELDDPVAISFSLQGTPPSCVGLTDGRIDILNLSGPNGNDFDFTWDANAGNQSTATATNLGAGAYSVTVTDAVGCQATDTLILTEPAPIDLSYVATHNPCFADALGTLSVVASGGSPSYSYLWSTGQQSSQLTQLPAGAYALTVTDSEGCEAELNVSISEPAELSAKALPTHISCFGRRDGMIDIIPEGGTPPF
ncbi:MAG: PKD domain-containing protein, partial [Bacteroidetes bacterium]